MKQNESVQNEKISVEEMLGKILRDKVDELKKLYDELMQKRSELMNELNKINIQLNQIESILVTLGVIEKKSQVIETSSQRGEKTKAIVEYIESLPSGAQFRYSDIMKRFPNYSRGIVYTVLKKMQSQGVIEKVSQGLYVKK